jgi:hypothetical protein
MSLLPRTFLAGEEGTLPKVSGTSAAAPPNLGGEPTKSISEKA